MTATSLLLFLNIAVFVFTDLLAGAFPAAAGWKAAGMSRAFEVWNGEWWRLVTTMFLHGGWLHLGMNMYGLYYLGPVLETSIGSARFLVIYFLAGIFGFVLSLLTLSLFTPTLGASGALFGIIGALIGDEARVGRHPLQFLDRDYGRTLVGLVVINLLLGFSLPGINNTAHLGGLVMGLLLTNAGLLRQVRRPTAPGRMLRAAAVILSLEVTLYSFFPVFNEGWQYTRAMAARDAHPQKALAAMQRALWLNPQFASYQEVRDFYQEMGRPLLIRPAEDEFDLEIPAPE